MADPLPYDNPLITRYASRPMIELWGPQRKHSTWRRLWLALAEAEHELGLTADDGVTPRITLEQIAEVRAHLDDPCTRPTTTSETRNSATTPRDPRRAPSHQRIQPLTPDRRSLTSSRRNDAAAGAPDHTHGQMTRRSRRPRRAVCMATS